MPLPDLPRPDHPPRPQPPVWRRVLRVLRLVKNQVQNDHVAIVSAGIAFYFFLALFPLITTLISIYGLAADPGRVESQLRQLSSVLPHSAHLLVSDFARSIIQSPRDTLNWGLVLSILFGLWSANRGSKALFRGVNIAYNVTERRGLVRTAVLTIGFTVSALLGVLLALVLVAAVPALPSWLGLSGRFAAVVGWLRWPVLAVLVIFFLACVYRFAPHRDRSRLRLVSIGSVVATGLWLAASALFSLYVEHLAKFEASYGSFAAVAILMLWFYLTAFSILLGAEINSELERGKTTDGLPA